MSSVLVNLGRQIKSNVTRFADRIFDDKRDVFRHGKTNLRDFFSGKSLNANETDRQRDRWIKIKQKYRPRQADR